MNARLFTSLIALWVLVPPSALAQRVGRDNYLNPGTMGPNALPPQPGESPHVGQGWTARIGIAVQRARYPHGGTDSSLIAPFRIDFPFANRVALLVEGSPAESWHLSQQTREAWGVQRTHGVSKADIRIGAKFLLFAGAGTLPAVSLRALTKTTTGKDVELRRFMNAPGYLFDLILGESWSRGDWEFEVWLAGGFLAWQQAGFGQNDAFSWSATTVGRIRDVGALRLEVRGYQGWVENDEPRVYSVGVEIPLVTSVALESAVNIGVRDPKLVEYRLGLRLGH